MDRRSFVSGSLGATFYAALMGDAKATGKTGTKGARQPKQRIIRHQGR